MDSYRPNRYTPPPQDRYRSSRYDDDDDDFHFRGAAQRERERFQANSDRSRYGDDMYDERPREPREPRDAYDVRPRYRSRSPRRSDGYERSEGYDSERSYGRREHGRFYGRAEFHDPEDIQPPPMKRQYRGHDRYYDDDPYVVQPPAPVDLPYRGESDVSPDGKPLKLLLIRDLKESVSEDLFAKGLDKLYCSDDSGHGAKEGSLRRVLLIRDRQTEKSMGFGFAEYHKVEDAVAAKAKAEELGEKCTISSKVIIIFFPHLSVFPRADFGVQEHSEKHTIVMPNTGARHKYHKENCFASELMVNPDSPYGASSPPRDGSNGVVSSNKSTLETLDSKPKKRKAAGASAPAFLKHWQNKAAELRGQEEEADAKAVEEKEKAKQPASGVNAMTTAPSPSPESEQTFCIDTQKLKCCYLCAGQFNTSEGLQRHLKESEKHAKNLTDAAATAKGFQRMKDKNVKPDSTIKFVPTTATAAKVTSENDSEQETQYRDRAAERRREEAQMGTKENVSFSLKGRSSKPDHNAGRSASSEPNTSSTPSYGKGLGMLQKAGWTEGQGLGNGNGIAAPIEQNVYAAGVGLGHEGSRKGDAVEEANRMTKNDRTEFLEKTKEVARQRFERLG